MLKPLRQKSMSLPVAVLSQYTFLPERLVHWNVKKGTRLWKKGFKLTKAKILMLSVKFAIYILYFFIFIHFFQGIEAIALRYTSLVSNVKKKNYNVLDHRKSDVWKHYFGWLLIFDFKVFIHNNFSFFYFCLIWFSVWCWLWRFQISNWINQRTVAEFFRHVVR